MHSWFPGELLSWRCCAGVRGGINIWAFGSGNGGKSQAWQEHGCGDGKKLRLTWRRRRKVFVFSGIIPVCHNDDGLAAVLGHEIAHNIAHHSAESLSRAAIMIPLAYLITALTGFSEGLVDRVLQVAWQMPGSRKQEVKIHSPARPIEGVRCTNHFYQSEADFIGLSPSMPLDHGPSTGTNTKRQ